MRFLTGAVARTEPAAVRSLIDRMRPSGEGHPRHGVRALASFDSVCLESSAIRGSDDQDGVFFTSDLAVVADARIDNLEDLRVALDCPPDLGVLALLAAGYRKWGSGLPSRLAGDFALAIWDAQRHVLMVARDPFGVRPLLYSWNGSRFLFASGEEALLSLAEVSREPDPDMILDYLTWQPPTPGRSFFRSIRRLPTGHLLELGPSGLVERRYWLPPVSEVALASTEEYHAEFRRLFTRAVSVRMRSGAPVMSHVSGGVDSTSILCVADGILKGSSRPCPGVRGVAAIHPGLNCDESTFIQAVSAHVSVPVECWDGTQALLTDLISPGVAQPGGRNVMSGGTEGDIEIARREGAAVILNGTGGDHLGSPVGVFEDMVARGSWRDAWRWGLADTSMGFRRARIRQIGVMFAPRWIMNIRRRFKPEADPLPWLTPWARNRGGARGPVEDVEANRRFLSHVARKHWLELTSPRLEAAVDVFQAHARANGMEARFPFLDKDLASFVLAIPFQHWPPPKAFERLHREALKDVLPPRIAARHSKAEFTSAVVNKVRRGMPLIRDVLRDSRWESRDFVDRDAVRLLQQRLEHQAGPASFIEWRGLWVATVLEVWLRARMEYSLAPKED